MTDYIKKDDALKCCPPIVDKHGHPFATSVEYDKIRKLEPEDVQPVKRGRWTPHPDPKCKEWDVCTSCGTGCKRREYGTNPDGTGYVTEWSYPYCPNCGSYNGADMRGGDAE